MQISLLACDTFDDENELPEQDEEQPAPAQVHLFQLLMEAMKTQVVILFEPLNFSFNRQVPICMSRYQVTH